MVRRIGLFGICVGASVFAILLLASQRYTDFNHRLTPNIRRNIQYLTEQSELISPYNSNHVLSTANINYTISIVDSINDVLRQQKLLITREVRNYKFNKGENLETLTPASGGKPIRNIIITTWRSGSTFLGDVLNAVPANYYHYEPLLDYEIIQIRGSPHADSAVRNLRRLLLCNYTGMDHYLNYGKEHIWLFTHNTRLWDQCQLYPQYCWNPTFLNPFCELFPFQSMKVVRLRLRLAEDLLKDKMLGVRILLLVRDPRGTLQSRRHRDWCPGQKDCDQASQLCADMVADYSAAIRLQRRYPDRFRVIRYEDLSLDAYTMVEDLFNFFRLDFAQPVKEFLDSHTKLNLGGVSSTFRNSKSVPFHWRSDLTYEEVREIEDQCTEAMENWGYVRTPNETSLKEFNPLKDYKVER